MPISGVGQQRTAEADVAATSSTPSAGTVESPVGDAGTVIATSRPATSQRKDAVVAASILVGVLLACVIGYLALAVPGSWFPRASARTWDAKDLTLTRGTGRIVGDALVVAAPDASSLTLVTVTGDLRSSDYAGIEWIVTGLDENADVRLLWKSDVRPDKLNSVPVGVAAGRTLATVVSGNAAWLGHIKGLAIAIHGPLPQPVHFRGVTASPMGAFDVLRSRFAEWFAFEPWNGASINTIVGGADYQQVPLAAVVALIVGIGALAIVAIARWRPAAFTVTIPAILAAFFLAGWLVLDARWTWNLVRQERTTALQFAGKDARDKHLASDDGMLFAFIEKARAVLPQTPVRIVIASDADYFRGRAAYHLYPHSVYFSARSNELPAAATLHPGDWLLVFQRRGIQYDRSQQKIRWEGGQTVSAELKLVEPGAALFVIR